MFEDGESIPVKGENGARTTKLAPYGKIVEFIYEDAKTLVEMVQRGCRISGNGRCLGWRSSNKGYSWISYQEFITRAKHFGSGLMKIGTELGQSNQIGIYSQNSVEWLIAQYGCFHFSSPIVPLYDTLGPDACIYMINHGAISVIICDKEKKVKCILDRKEVLPTLKHIICIENLTSNVKNLGKEKGVNLHLFEDIEDIGILHPVPFELPKPSDVALICYTSGTTGNPKGVLLTHGNMASLIQALVLHLGSVVINERDTMISYLPLAHVFEQFCEALIFLTGGSVGFFGGDVSLLLNDMKILQPTFFPAVPRLLNKLLDKAQAQVNKDFSKTHENDDFVNEKSQKGLSIQDCDLQLYESFKESLGGKIKLILSAAAPILESVLKFYRKALNCNVIEIYGQTEATGPCTLNIVSDTSFGHVGTPLACCMIKLVDVPELGYLTKDNKGEVCIKGYNVMKSYYKDPERTSEAIDKDGWLHTGDIAMWLLDGNIKIIDRKKHIFKLSQGEYVAPEKLENLYLQSPYISQIFIHGDSLQSYVVAIVIPDEEIVMFWCKENLNCESFVEACKKSAVKQLILEDMKRIAKKAKILSFEQVKKIHLHPKLLTFEEGLLTPTSKTKRATCFKYFEKQIHTMYLESED